MLHYKTIGQGRPIIILHGLFGSSDNWRTFARQFEENHTVILPDLRNHGRSLWSTNFDYEIMSADVIHLIDHLGHDKVHVIGHSMGGKLALNLINTFAQRIHRTVVIDIAPKRYDPGHEHIFEAVLGLDLEKLQSRQEADHELRMHIPEPEVRQFIMKSLARQNGGKGFRWKTNFDSLLHNYENILEAIPMNEYEERVLFVKGSRSYYITGEDEDLIKKNLISAEFVELDTGHWVHTEQPVKLFRSVSSFLNEED